ncbi:xanthine dioxygenase, partial [Phenoliferia sp. Uapishka_3]
MPATSASLIRIEPVDHGVGSTLAFGATATGVDLEDLDEASFRIIEDALYRFKVLVIKNQKHLTPVKQFKFVQRLDPDAPKEHSAGPRKETQERYRPNQRTLLEEYRTPDMPDCPEVRMIGNGKVETPHYGLEGEVFLKQASHQHQHKNPMQQEELDKGLSRWLRWHMDASCFRRDPPCAAPPKVTTLHCIKNPVGPPITVKWDDGTGTEMVVPAGATGFTDSATTFKMMSPADQELARNSKVEYWPHPYVQNGMCKIGNAGLGLLSEGLEIPLEDLPPYDEKEIKIYPLAWHNPVTGEEVLSVHSVCARRLHLKHSPTSEVRILDDLKEVRDLLFKWQRPAVEPNSRSFLGRPRGLLSIAPANRSLLVSDIWAASYEEGDMVAFCNRLV